MIPNRRVGDTADQVGRIFDGERVFDSPSIRGDPETLDEMSAGRRRQPKSLGAYAAAGASAAAQITRSRTAC
jgi:hypothetical protein